MRLRLLATLCLLLAVAGPAAAQRLPGTVVPERYDLWFAPDLATATFRGRTTIAVTVAEPTDAITLHAAELTFGEVTVEAAGRTQTAAVRLDPASETVTLQLAAPVPAGPATLRFTYTGLHNDRLRGFYLSEANGRRYAVTQLEATDARRAFPAFDEPEYKAVFSVSLMVADGDTAISNGALVSDTPGPEPGRHTLVFEPTLKMASYLVAMFVGDFECREGGVGDVPIRICSTPDKVALTGFALEAAEQQIAFYNDYFGIRYPFAKLDVIAVPDFAAGAMENTGAVAFRERLLLADPDRASLNVRKNIAEVLSHEIAHMWFGDLVTMAWWDDIWLNEGFATWTEKRPLAAWRPDWNVELDEALDTQGAIGIDALQATRPVRVAASTPEQINEVFDGIAYEKAAAVIRMVEAYVGRERFREAIRSYVRRYAFDNAAAEDLWNELARVTGAPLDTIMASYIDQPGVPVLRVETGCQAGDTAVTLTQERFTGTPGAAPGPGTWTVPVCFADAAGGAPRCEVMTALRQTVTLPGCGAPVFANADAAGYYLTQYDPAALAALAAVAGTALSPVERIGLLGDEWWMLRSGRHDAGAFLDLAGALAGDETPAITAALGQRLGYTAAYLTPPGRGAELGAWVRERFGPALASMDMVGDPDDGDAVQSRRAALIGLVGGTGNDPEVQARARELALGYMDDPASLPGTLVQTILNIAAAGGDAALYDRFLGELGRLGADPEAYYRYFFALASFGDPALAARTLDYALSDDVRSQDSVTLIAGVMGQARNRDQAWAFVQERWDDISRKLSNVFTAGVQGVIGSLGSFCSAESAGEIAAFFASNPVPEAERRLARALEQVRTCAAVQARQRPAVAAWLDAQR